MFSQEEIPHALIVDIETTTVYKTVEELQKNEPFLYNSFEKKIKWYAENEYHEDITPEFAQKIYQEKAPLFPEYAKIIVISCGGFKDDEIRFKSFAEESEKDVLEGFFDFLQKKLKVNQYLFISGYNIMLFDIPFMIKRAYINNVKIPPFLRIGSKKPWDLTAQFKDIFTLWQMGSKNYMSLEAVAASLGLVTHKSEMDGSKVYNTYYNEPDGLKKVQEYCEKDIVLTGKVMERLIFI